MRRLYVFASLVAPKLLMPTPARELLVLCQRERRHAAGQCCWMVVLLVLLMPTLVPCIYRERVCVYVRAWMFGSPYT